MAPSAGKLKEALVEGTREVYRAEPDGTSVNKVRRHVEEKLGLEDGFFTSETWKQKSKTIIKEQVDKLLDEDASEPKYESDTKVGIKRPSSEVESPQPKRRKKKAEPAKKKEESEGDDAPKKESSVKVKKLASRRKAKTDDSDEEGAKLKGSPSPAGGRKRSVKQESEDESKPKVSDRRSVVARVKEQDTPGDEIKPSIKSQHDSGAEDAKAAVKDEPKPEMNEEDEYSDVIDEPQPTKRKRVEKKESSSKPRASKPAAKKEAATPDDPKDAEIKKLQSQLAKCGIRKLWHIELKQYGDNAGAKIRHLKKMLADVGMEGRFSEAKAREIKEMRELRADVEAAQEMDRLWGTSSGGRASRSKSKTTKQEAKLEIGDDEEEDNGNDDVEPTSFAARRRKAHADLAFLGDESDSD
ncbi:transcriptional regulator [Trichoderma cornu-damae]|uniref:Transcriptional regulator n=1 Tax=Trichoderma cornu-damae TaxID=654480 RepID=A0A9P8QGY7_9HYPO|nr:transcriptional regulator [Trichoderma cornu-damae]